MPIDRPQLLACAALLAFAASCTATAVKGTGSGATTGGTTGGPVCTCSSDPVCGTANCDDAGACAYPAVGTLCPGVFCRDATYSQMACNGAGSCAPTGTGTACPGDFACSADGGCNTSCRSAADCVPGFVCNAGSCGRPIAAGACTENDDCSSGICGASGTGNCCQAPCATSDRFCGSTGCDDAGACVYPTPGVVCGDTELSCTGSTRTNANICDGAGHCGGGTTDCAPYACGLRDCKTSCAVNADCVAGVFCDVPAATCCEGLVDGGTFAVDSALGDDTLACCGFAGAKACRSLTRATGLIAAGPTTNLLLLVTIDGGASGDWTAEGETYPIFLGWGVELSAPGIFFQGPADAGRSSRPPDAIFGISIDAGGTDPVSIVGTDSNPVGIGMDVEGNELIAASAIEESSGSVLYLANASINGNWWDDGYGIDTSGTLIIGQDRSGAVTGQVRIGNDFANSATDGYVGIGCDGCTLRDVPTGAPSTLVMTGQQFAGIYAGDDCTISLTSAPVFGIAPSALGFGTCPAKPDGIGIYLTGSATMTLDRATLQCMHSIGIVVADYLESATVTLSRSTIQHTANALAVSGARSVVVSSSSIRYNAQGVVTGDLGDAGILDLSGGTMGGRNTIACSNNIENYGGGLAISVWNQTGTTLNASNVDWDTPGPDVFDCSTGFTSCTCQSSSCTDAPGANGMDAVVTSTGSITTTGNGLSPLDCTVPPG